MTNKIKILLLLFILQYSSSLLFAQTDKIFRVFKINLSDSLAHPENQFSGLTYRNHKLYLLCESRIQENHIARIYSINKKELKKAIADSSYQPAFKTILIKNLDKVKTQIDAGGNLFEGLEAIDVKGKNVWLTIETISPSLKGYVISGKLKKNELIINNKDILSLDIPLKDGEILDNSGFESIAYKNGKLLAAFEYNYFDNVNMFYSLNKKLSDTSVHYLAITKVPFRITDWQFTGKDRLVALNVFYKGKADSYFRVPPTDSMNYKYIVNDKEQLENFARIIQIYKTSLTSYKGVLHDAKPTNKKTSDYYNWETVGLLPNDYGKGYNWEGITTFKKGYFITNDKFTPTRERKSYLLYIELP